MMDFEKSCDKAAGLSVWKPPMRHMGLETKGMAMKFLICWLVLAFTVVGTADAQVRKCTGPDGKITYSDFICGKNTASEASVRTDYNTIDSSGSRLDAQRMKTDEAVKAALQKDGGSCKFSYFALGDEKGKTLAAAAKQECLDNIRAKASGQPTTLEAYGFWKDHSAQKSTDRQASITRAAAAENARTTQDSIDKINSQLRNQPSTFKCKPNAFNRNETDCKSQ